MKRWKVFVGSALLTAAVSYARATSRQGESLEVTQLITGVSGRTGLVSDGGFRFDYTVGAPLEGIRLMSPSGIQISPGLWGGSAFQAKGGTNVIAFGDPTHPARLVVSPNAIPVDWVIFISTDPMTRPLAVSPAAVQQANDNLSKTLTPFTRPVKGQIWEILVLDAAGRRYSSLLNAEATLTLPYPDANNDGVVDGTQPALHAADLAVWWLDETHNLWVKLSESRVDASAQVVSAPIRHFSVFTVMGVPSFNPGDTYAFPVPWRPFGPNAGTGSGQTGTLSGGITFTNLPSAVTIRVYTLSGQPVREINHSDGTPQTTWDVRNGSGEDVPSGTYIYVVESGGHQKTGKIVVIR